MREFLRLLALVPALLFMTVAADAQDPIRHAPPDQFPGEGSELLRALLHLNGIKPVKQHELHALFHRDDVIVIVLGSMRRNFGGMFEGSQYCHNAMVAGGAVLIATHEMVEINTFPGFDPIKITGIPVDCNDPNSILQNHLQDCPYVVPSARPGNEKLILSNEELLKLFHGDGAELKPLTRVAAGTPSYILLGQNNQTLLQLAKFPKHSFARTNLQHTLPASADFAVGGQIDLGNGASQFLALASSRVFNNGMLRADKTDNLEFSFRVIDYLQGPQRHRKQCVFIENGQLVEHFDDLAQAVSFQNQPIPIPRPKVTQELQKQVVKLADRWLKQLETNDTVNKILNKLNVWPILLALVAIGVSWVLFIRTVSSGKPTSIPAAPVVLAASSGPPGVFERRQKELLRRNNIYEPVRDYVREFFAGLGIHGEPGSKPPKVVVSDLVRKPKSLKLAIQDFWKLAYGKPEQMSVQRWQEMEPYFERLQDAHADGKWRFVMPTV